MLAEGESLSQHAAVASQRALEMAGIAAEDVDLIILATSSPDDLFGSACQARPCFARCRPCWGLPSTRQNTGQSPDSWTSECCDSA